MTGLSPITATFIGKDGSLGYRTGQQYLLYAEGNTIVPRPDSGARPCPYGSVAAFLRNWDNITQVSIG